DAQHFRAAELMEPDRPHHGPNLRAGSAQVIRRALWNGMWAMLDTLTG
ncbi:MAG: hypothetical protein QOD04_4269, partial [Pseudonocardiales bacterium]|nr:hypothetical protein [Pseudonocardiales bacterium]